MQKPVLQLLVFLMLCVFANSSAIAQTIIFTEPVPADIPDVDMCGASSTYTITVKNVTNSLMTGVTLTMYLPVGAGYELSSVTGTGVSENNTSNPREPIFSLPDLAANQSLTITYKMYASCAVVAPFSKQNFARVDYTQGGTAGYAEFNAGIEVTPAQLLPNFYDVKRPNVSIINITNKTYPGNVGDVYQRCITIKNGGEAPLDTVYFEDTHGSGVDITAIDKGTLTVSGTSPNIVHKVMLAGADLGADNVLTPNEEVVVCETVSIISCSNLSLVNSAFKTYWGCRGNASCQNNQNTANITFPNNSPSLGIAIASTFNVCPSTPDEVTITITNNTSSQAGNVKMRNYSYYGGNIDFSSYSLTINGVAQTQPVPYQTGNVGVASSCTEPNKTDAYFDLPNIPANSTVVIKVKQQRCCNDVCAKPSYPWFGTDQAFYVTLTYGNACGTGNYSASTNTTHYYDIATILPDSYPSSLAPGQSGTAGFAFPQHYGNYLEKVGGMYEMEFILSPCVVFDGEVEFVRSTDQILSPVSTTVSPAPTGDTVRAYFLSAPTSSVYYYKNGVVNIDLKSVCGSAACPDGGTANIRLNHYLIPDSECDCRARLACANLNIAIGCAPCLDGGMLVSNYYFNRSNFGLPDNEANGGSGQPDAAGALDFSKIRTDRAIHGDTITANMQGVVLTTASNPSWTELYAVTNSTNSQELDFLDATLKIKTADGTVYNCTGITPMAGYPQGSKQWRYDLSVSAISGACGLPANFTFGHNDSVWFRPRYRVGTNPGAIRLTNQSDAMFFVSTVPNSSGSTDAVTGKYSYMCGSMLDNITLYRHFEYYIGAGATSQTCAKVGFWNYSVTYIGDYTDGYAVGSNLFPYEYRNFGQVDTMVVRIPSGWDYVPSTSYVRHYYRIAGGTYTSVQIPVTPTQLNDTTYVFNIAPTYSNNGGTAPMPDDAFNTYLYMEAVPSCHTKPFTYQYYNDDYMWSTKFPGFEHIEKNFNSGWLYHYAPELVLQPTSVTNYANDNTVTWDVVLQNANAYPSANTWFGGSASNGVTITQIIDLSTNTPLPSNNGIFEIGALAASASKNYRVVGTYNNCTQAEITLNAGWGCSGYPSSVETYKEDCKTDTSRLKAIPNEPLFNLSITPPSANTKLCDQATYILTGKNVQLGTGYDVVLEANLPAVGLAIVPGTTQISYPLGSPYVTVADPTNTGGSSWAWDVSALNAQIGTDGLKGTANASSLTTFNLKFNVETTCGFVSGSVIDFTLNGTKGCGAPMPEELVFSPPLNLQGATPYVTIINISGENPLNTCSTLHDLTFNVKNIGPNPTFNNDSVYVFLPPQTSYVAGSYTALNTYAASTGTLPISRTINGKPALIWKIPAGVPVDSTASFKIQYNITDNSQACGQKLRFEADTRLVISLTCSTSNTPCETVSKTGIGRFIPVITKPTLSAINVSASSVTANATNESVTTAFTLKNTAAPLPDGTPINVNIYQDVDNSGTYTTGDVLLSSEVVNSIGLTTNGTLDYTKTFNVAAGKACNLVANITTCACSPLNIPLKPRLLNAGTDLQLCHGGSGSLGFDPITGYTYTWTPGTDLSATNISKPSITSATNTGTTAITNTYIVETNRIGCTTKDTALVVINPQVIAAASGATTITCANPTATLSGTGSSTFTGATYAWTASGGGSITANGTTLSPTSSGAGGYTLTVTGLGGCTATASVSISANTATPNASAGASKILTCTTTSIALAGSSSTTGVTYAWTAGGGATAANITANETTGTPTVNAAGTYTLTVTDPNNGCTATSSVSVSLNNAAPNASAGANKTVTCVNNNPVLSGSSSTTGATYAWTATNGGSIVSGGATLSPTAGGTGTYTLTVTGPNGCTATSSASVSVNTTPPNVSAGSSSQLSCSVTSVSLGGSSTTSPISVLWTTSGGNITAGDTTLTPTVNKPGTYTLTVTDKINGCTATASVQITGDTQLPTANAGSSKTLTCTTTSLQLTGSTNNTNFTTVWTTTGGNIVSGANTLTPIVNAAGGYTLTVTNPLNGCTATSSISIKLNTVAPGAGAGSPKTITCTTTSVTLNGTFTSPNSTFAWTGPNGFTSTILQPSVTEQGQYNLTVTDPINGCTSTASVSVSLNNTRPAISVGNSQTLTCQKTSAVLAGSSSTANATFAWTGPNGFTSTQAQPTVTQAGAYTLTVTDPVNGCTTTASVSIVSNVTAPNVSAGIDKTTTCTNTSVILSGSSTTPNAIFAWTGPSGFSSTQATPVASNAGNYTLIVTDPINGCTAADQVTIFNGSGMPTMTATSNNPCSGQNLQLTTAGGQTGFTYSWVGPNNFTSAIANPQITNVGTANTGNYTVTITGTNGCTLVKSLYVNVQSCCNANASEIQVITPNLCAGDLLKVSTNATLPQTGYEYYFLLVNQATGIIVEKVLAINNTPITFATTTSANYLVYGYSVKTGLGTAPAITVGTTTINTLLTGTNANGSNFTGTNCYDLSAASGKIFIPAPFSIHAQSGNIYEGNQGGISPFNYTVHEIYVLGGTPPYNYNWSNTNFVKPGIQEAIDANHTLTLPDGTAVNGPGTNVEILYADNATWHLTITDANGCSNTLLVFSNDAGANGQTDTIGGKILDIDNYQIKGNVLNQQNGAVRICVSGGEVGCVPSFQWSGPQSWTNTAPASAPGMTTGTTAPGACGAGTTAYNLTGLPTGWYTVTVTCGSQTTEGWYWVPKKRPGRGGKDDLENGYIDAYPNPFSNVTNIGFVSGVTGETVVNLYSIDGKKMVELYKGETIENEAYTIQLQANDLANGMYVITLQQADGTTITQKVVLSK